MMHLRTRSYPVYKLTSWSLIVCTGLLLSCNKQENPKNQSYIVASKQASGSSSSNSQSSLKMYLTDAPNKNIKSVFVDIDHIELFLEKKGKEGRVVIGQNLGSIDLMTLQNGVTIPIQNTNLPADVHLKQLRIVLKESGHYLIKDNDQRCDMRTPSAQKTGIKVLVKNSPLIEDRYNYSLVVDFDANKSIVLQGNGGCLLKPVLKIKSLNRVDETVTDPLPGSGDVVIDNSSDTSTDTSVSDNGSDGMDTTPENQLPPIVAQSELPQYFPPDEQTQVATAPGSESQSSTPSNSTTGPGSAPAPITTTTENSSSTTSSTNTSSSTPESTSTTATNSGTSIPVATTGDSNTSPVVSSPPTNNNVITVTDSNGQVSTVILPSNFDPNDVNTWPSDLSEEQIGAMIEAIRNGTAQI